MMLFVMIDFKFYKWANDENHNFIINIKDLIVFIWRGTS